MRVLLEPPARGMRTTRRRGPLPPSRHGRGGGNNPARAQRPFDSDGGDVTEAIATVYRGISMRSKLEADWASTLDHYAITWRYEPYLIQLETGELYLPDFWLPDLRTFIEVKGMGIGRTEKTMELAREQPRGVIVLFGFAPARREVTPALWDSFLQWRDAAGYDARFTVCGNCATWQWTRPQLTKRCRVCRAALDGLLASCGELPFTHAQPDHVTLMGEQRCPG